MKKRYETFFFLSRDLKLERILVEWPWKIEKPEDEIAAINKKKK